MAKGEGKKGGGKDWRPKGVSMLASPGFAAGARVAYAKRYAGEVERIRRLLPPGSKWIDSHCHLESILYRTWNGGVKPLVMDNEEPLDLHGLVASWPPGLEGCVCNIAFRKLSEVWGECSEWQWLDHIMPLLEPGTLLGDKIWFTIGLHPSCSDLWDAEAERHMRRLSSHPRCVAIGECGLDFSFHGHEGEAELQLHAFRSQAALAVELGKCLVVHARQAEALCFQVLSEVVPPKHPVHIHCYTESLQNARDLCEGWENLMIGFTGCITFGVENWTAKGYMPGKGKGKRDRPDDFVTLIEGLPLSRLLIETDGPYMCPEPFRMQTAHPGHVHRVAERIAEIKRVPLAEVMEVIRENCKVVYGI